MAIVLVSNFNRQLLYLESMHIQIGVGFLCIPHWQQKCPCILQEISFHLTNLLTSSQCSKRTFFFGMKKTSCWGLGFSSLLAVPLLKHWRVLESAEIVQVNPGRKAQRHGRGKRWWKSQRKMELVWAEQGAPWSFWPVWEQNNPEISAFYQSVGT